METNAEVLSGLVVKCIRDGRCRYDPQVKQELVKRCLQSGVSVAALAMQHGVNANLMRKWITKWQSRTAMQQAASGIAPQNTSAFLALPVNMATPHAAVTTVARKASPHRPIQ